MNKLVPVSRPTELEGVEFNGTDSRDNWTFVSSMNRKRSGSMGLIHATIELRNPLDSRLAPYIGEALVDTGALLLCIPEHVATQLRLQTLQEREATTADGKKHVCPYVGPVEVTFGNRSCFVGALVSGEEMLLGAVPMEDLDLVISPASQTVQANPESPNLPMAPVK